MSRGTVRADPDQTNMYKADGVIWLILLWIFELQRRAKRANSSQSLSILLRRCVQSGLDLLHKGKGQEAGDNRETRAGKGSNEAMVEVGNSKG